MEVPDLRVLYIGGVYIIGKWTSPELVERPRMFQFVQLPQGQAIKLIPIPGSTESIDLYGPPDFSFKPNEEMTKIYLKETTGLTLAGPGGRLS